MRTDRARRVPILAPILRGFKFRKSGGVAVTAEVHARIRLGNAARDMGAWPNAAHAYRAALEDAPGLFHVWMQLGHAHKEDGSFAEADAAYGRAQDLAPLDPEPPLHRGHLAKRRGDIRGAARAYLAAARSDPRSTAAVTELGALLSKGVDINMAELIQFVQSEPDDSAGFPNLRGPDGDAPTGGEPMLAAGRSFDPGAASNDDRTTTGVVRPCLVFDISDLLAYFGNARMPTGIQRVQIETLSQALTLPDVDVRICGFLEARDEWVELPHDLFDDLCRLSRSGHQDDWARCFARVTIHLSVGAVFVFPHAAFLINLGTSWWIPNYFMFVRRAKRESGIRYVPFVHDLIPLIRGDLCPPLLVQDYTAWAVSVLDHADFYLVNSQSTKRDLIAVSTYLDRPIASDKIEVVPLDAVYQTGDAPRQHPAILRRHGLRPSSFVLLVSTIEPRKNHLMAFEAWTTALRQMGHRKMPTLVCVGNPGWMNEPVYGHLTAHPDLQAKVVILSHLTDEDLADLYRTCLFTLYPSHYEGWGLPVTEALSHGKVPLCSRTSSLPEAGGVFADYFDLDSPPDLARSLDRLIFDADYRRARERRIAADFAPRSWRAIARQIVACMARWSPTDPDDTTDGMIDALAVAPAGGVGLPVAQPGRYHSLSRNLAPRFWPGLRSTEALRAGWNWWGRDLWGCWTKPGGGTLGFAVEPPCRTYRLYLQVLSMPHTACSFAISVNGIDDLAVGVLAPDERRWICIDVPGSAVTDGTIEIEVASSTFEDLGETTTGGDSRLISIGVCGFYLCDIDDTAARLALVEAIALGTVDALSVNHPPAVFPSLATYLENPCLAR